MESQSAARNRTDLDIGRVVAERATERQLHGCTGPARRLVGRRVEHIGDEVRVVTDHERVHVRQAVHEPYSHRAARFVIGVSAATVRSEAAILVHVVGTGAE